MIDLDSFQIEAPLSAADVRKPAAQAVAGVGGRIQPDPAGVPLHDPRRAVVRQGVVTTPVRPASPPGTPGRR